MNFKLHNRKELKEKRKELRNSSTSAEAVLWTLLKKSQLCGRKFRRQQSMGNYIVDFYCPQENLAIELDGHFHFTVFGFDWDDKRTRFLNRNGITVLRFENKQIFNNQEAVLRCIAECFVDCEFNHPRFTK